MNGITIWMVSNILLVCLFIVVRKFEEMYTTWQVFNWDAQMEDLATEKYFYWTSTFD